MASIGKIYGAPAAAKVTRVVAAANVNGLELEVVPTLPIQDSHKPEFLAKFPLGKVPTFEGTDGVTLTESRTILKYGTYTWSSPSKMSTFSYPCLNQTCRGLCA